MLYFSIQNCRQDRTGKVSEAAGARWQFYPRIFGYPRISVGLSSNRLYIGGSNSGILRCNPAFRISWQAQYLVRLEGGFVCSAHWKWRFICVADRWWPSFCVAGAVFGEVGGWFYLLCALEMMFHMRRTSLLTFIFCGRRSIWWGWRVTLLAPRIGNDIVYVTQIADDLYFLWQAQYLEQQFSRVTVQ